MACCSLVVCATLSQAKYRASSRELKRLDSVTRSPLYIHLEECLEGRAVIRSHGPDCVQSEEDACLDKLDENQVGGVPSVVVAVRAFARRCNPVSDVPMSHVRGQRL